MKILKPGQHRLLERDQETIRVVSEMLEDLERNGMEAVRKYSARFDEWEPESFELSAGEIEKACGQLSEQALRDTDYCQGNVRAFRAGATGDDASAGSGDSAGGDAGAQAYPGGRGGQLHSRAGATRCSGPRR